MARLLTLLIMLVLVVANGPAVATAICEHQDALAHAAALQRTDAGVSAEALSEEMKAASMDGALSDAARTLLAGCILPSDTALPRRAIESATIDSAEPRRLVSRSVPPLLEPPLA